MSTFPCKPPLHFVGIGGSGMAPLAELCHRQGLQVQGSDSTGSAVIASLENLGIKIFPSHAEGNIRGAQTLIYSTAIPKTNPELVAAEREKISLMHRSDLLAWLTRGKRTIAVAGTHGKTTTSALITHMLTGLGEDPSAAIGGVFSATGSAARLGKSALFVAEADESDGSFIKYHPYISVITNVDHDHMNNFPTIESLKDLFRRYLQNTDPEGAGVIGWDNAHSRELGQGLSHNRLTYGFVLGSEVRALNYRQDQGRSFFTAVVERDQIDCELNMLGQFNVQNALAALAVARALELDCRQAAATFRNFPGVMRRQHLVYTGPGLKVFDDYAHNPGKAQACIHSLKEAWPDHQLWVIYQPHRYSRLQTMYQETVAAFAGADQVVILPVYSAGEAMPQGFDLGSCARDIARNSHTAAQFSGSFAEAAHTVLAQTRKPAIILTMGAGDVWRLAIQLRDLLHDQEKEIKK